MEDGIYFLQERSGLGFLCDSEWDGDSFTKDPTRAWMTKVPKQEGRGGVIYDCVKIKFWTVKHAHHTGPYLRDSKHRGKDRVYLKCIRCHIQTRDYANEQNAHSAWEKIPSECYVTYWQRLPFTEEEDMVISGGEVVSEKGVSS